MPTLSSRTDYELRRRMSVWYEDPDGYRTRHSQCTFDLLHETWTWARVPRQFLASRHDITCMSRRPGQRLDWVLIPMDDAQRFQLSYTGPNRLIRVRNNRAGPREIRENMLPPAYYEDRRIRDHTNSLRIGDEIYVVVEAGWEYYFWHHMCEYNRKHGEVSIIPCLRIEDGLILVRLEGSRLSTSSIGPSRSLSLGGLIARILDFDKSYRSKLKPITRRTDHRQSGEKALRIIRGGRACRRSTTTPTTRREIPSQAEQQTLETADRVCYRKHQKTHTSSLPNLACRGYGGGASFPSLSKANQKGRLWLMQ